MCSTCCVSNHFSIFSFFAHVRCKCVHKSCTEILCCKCFSIIQCIYLVGCFMCYNNDTFVHCIFQGCFNCARVDRNYAKSVNTLIDHIVNNLNLRSCVCICRSFLDYVDSGFFAELIYSNFHTFEPVCCVVFCYNCNCPFG